MSQRIFTNQVFSNTGVVGVGFKINFLETGTTTPKTTFLDTALTVPNINPIIADANGRFIDVFVNDVKDYKTVLTDVDDNILKTLDPVDPKTASAEDFDPRPLTLWGITAGTADNYTLAANTPIGENKNTHVFLVEIHLDCNAAPDLAVDGLTALNLKKYDGASGKVDLEEDDMQASQRYFITNDGVDYVVLNPEKPKNIFTNSFTGSVTAFAFDTPPASWLECDGAAVSRTTFATLFGAIGIRFGVGDGSTTFNVPDLRGEFIRGYANGSSNDPDRASRTNSGDGTTGDNVGTKQLDSMQRITGQFSGSDIGDAIEGGVMQFAGTQTNNSGNTTTTQEYTFDNADSVSPNTAKTNAIETRPRNISMMYCIKF